MKGIEKLNINNKDREINIRPSSLKEYIGQDEIKENIDIFIKASNLRNSTLDHVLLYGPPGLGKTTLAHIIANELHTSIKTASGPSIEKSGDLAAVLSTLEENDVLFIDEIHRIPKFVEEILYGAMEDFKLDIILGNDGTNRSVKLDLPKFTLVGATTRVGDLTAPLRDRFGIICKLNYYTNEELSQIILRTSSILNTKISDEASIEIAKRSRKTPRIANRLLKRVTDFAIVENLKEININITKSSLNRLNVDEEGLDEIDKEYLLSLIKKFDGGPVGIETISASMSEEIITILDIIEPFLLQEGFIQRTSRGRVATKKAYEHFHIN